MSTIINASVTSVRNDYKVINNQGKEAKEEVKDRLCNPLQVIKAYKAVPAGKAYLKSLGYNPTKVHLNDFATYVRGGHFIRPVSVLKTAERLYRVGRLYCEVDENGVRWYEKMPYTVESFAKVLKSIERVRKAYDIAQAKSAKAKVMPTDRKLGFARWLKYQDKELPMAQLEDMYTSYTKQFEK